MLRQFFDITFNYFFIKLTKEKCERIRQSYTALIMGKQNPNYSISQQPALVFSVFWVNCSCQEQSVTKDYFTSEVILICSFPCFVSVSTSCWWCGSLLLLVNFIDLWHYLHSFTLLPSVNGLHTSAIVI